MSDAYSTLINWLNDTGITGYFHDLSWSAIALIAICIALPVYIKFKNKPKSKTLLEKSTEDKKVTSNLNFFTQVAIFLIMSIVSAIACFNFGYERMGIEGGAIAACISLAIFGACLRNNRKHSKIQTVVEWSVLVPLVLFEMVVIGANFITVGENKPAAMVEQKRASYNAEILRLSNRLVSNPRSNTDKYDNRLIEKDIRAEKAKLEDLPVYRNSEKKFYEQAAALLGFHVYIVELLFNVGIGCLLVIACTMGGTRINSYVCP